MKKLLAVLAALILIVMAGILVMLFVISHRTQPSGEEPAAVSMPPTGTSVNIFDGNLRLRNFTLVNPEGFTERTFISIPRFSVDIDTATIGAAGEKHFRQVRMEIAEVYAIRRKDGKYNFEWILHQKKAQAKAEATAKRQKQRITIDRLHIVFGRIIFLDYTVRGDKPLYVRFDVDMSEQYDNVTDMDELGKKVSKKFLDKLTIGETKNLELKDLPDIARSAMAAIPDDTKDRVFGKGPDQEKVLKELSKRLTNKIKDQL